MTRSCPSVVGAVAAVVAAVEPDQKTHRRQSWSEAGAVEGAVVAAAAPGLRLLAAALVAAAGLVREAEAAADPQVDKHLGEAPSSGAAQHRGRNRHSRDAVDDDLPDAVARPLEEDSLPATASLRGKKPSQSRSRGGLPLHQDAIYSQRQLSHNIFYLSNVHVSSKAGLLPAKGAYKAWCLAVLQQRRKTRRAGNSPRSDAVSIIEIISDCICCCRSGPSIPEIGPGPTPDQVRVVPKLYKLFGPWWGSREACCSCLVYAFLAHRPSSLL